MMNGAIDTDLDKVKMDMRGTVLLSVENFNVAFSKYLPTITKQAFVSLDDYIAALACVNVAFFYHREGLIHLDALEMEEIVFHFEQAYFAGENTLCYLLLSILQERAIDEVGFKISYFKSKHRSSEESFTPSSEYLLHLCVALGLVGKAWGLTQLWNKGYQLAQVLLQISKENSSVLYSAWSRSDQGSFSHLDFLSDLMRSFYLQKETFAMLKARIDKEKIGTDPVAALLFLLAEKQTPNAVSVEPGLYQNSLNSLENILGFSPLNHAPFTGGMFSKGSNISLGFLKKGDVEISAMGPLKGSLDCLDCFGIYQNIDLKINDFTLWSRCADQKDNQSIPSKESLFFSFEPFGEKIALKTYLKAEKSVETEINTFFTFFVEAKYIVINGNVRVEQKGLNGFQGRVKQLELVGSSSMHWSFSKEIFIYIAPLPRKDFFWKTSFLIAYSLKGMERTFTIHIT
ncbi:hypothetical protein COB21_01515 [Candidatus Aerophobetes bacterium]|uniref:Uncharacterized protein n=1 Tax=Aerophobetes bacterium TaxID=2030807 RepID=A0A2A4X6E0_UNCAE|nr:MAG: hypothetical protein COB21_01515 [Candidatus Aerophobetes bacterium]